jgi:hypothetical protein
MQHATMLLPPCAPLVLAGTHSQAQRAAPATHPDVRCCCVPPVLPCGCSPPALPLPRSDYYGRSDPYYGREAYGGYGREAYGGSYGG